MLPMFPVRPLLGCGSRWPALRKVLKNGPSQTFSSQNERAHNRRRSSTSYKRERRRETLCRLLKNRQRGHAVLRRRAQHVQVALHERCRFGVALACSVQHSTLIVGEVGLHNIVRLPLEDSINPTPVNPCFFSEGFDGSPRFTGTPQSLDDKSILESTLKFGVAHIAGICGGNSAWKLAQLGPRHSSELRSPACDWRKESETNPVAPPEARDLPILLEILEALTGHGPIVPDTVCLCSPTVSGVDRATRWPLV